MMGNSNSYSVQSTARRNGNIFKVVLMLCMSVVLIMSVFFSLLTPVPMGMVIQTVGRRKGAFFILLATVALFGLELAMMSVGSDAGEASRAFTGQFTLLYGLSAIFAVLISSEVIKGTKPARAITKLGFGIYFGSIGLATSYLVSTAQNLKPFVIDLVKQAKASIETDPQMNMFIVERGKEAAEVMSYLSNPEKTASIIIRELPVAWFMVVFIAVWVNYYALARLHRMKKIFSGDSPAKSVAPDSEMFNFRVPESFVWVVILGMACYLAADLEMAKQTGWPLEFIGISILKVVGVFYFFHGFGVLTGVFDHWKIFGFFRALIILLLIFYQREVIPLIGLFDIWFDFRTRFKPSDDQTKGNRS